MQTNNKVRNALEQVKELARTIYSTSDVGSHHEDLAEKIVELATAALATPLLNWEVGTAEEQSRRFCAFCRPRTEPCDGCACLEASRKGRCEFVWAQLPYKDGGDK